MLDLRQFQWTRQPKSYAFLEEGLEVITAPHTDLWQRTYYHFRNDNAPVFQMETEEQFFSFQVKTTFESKHRFDQCGVVMYLDSENWLKGSIEYENETFQHLGSVATNHGHHRHRRLRSLHVVPPQPAAGRFLHRVLHRRGPFQSDAGVPYVGGPGADPLRRLRLQPRGLLLPGGVYRHGADRV